MHPQFFQLVPFALVAALAMAQHQNDAAPGSGCRGTRSTWSLVATQWWGMLRMVGTVGDAGMVGVSCKPPFLCKWAMSETWNYQPMSHNIAYARPYACFVVGLCLAHDWVIGPSCTGGSITTCLVRRIRRGSRGCSRRGTCTSWIPWQGSSAPLETRLESRKVSLSSFQGGYPAKAIQAPCWLLEETIIGIQL